LFYYPLAMVDSQKPQDSAEAREPILVVDDDPFILQAVKRLLHGLGHPVITIPSPQEALDILGRLPAALVITDYMMPGIDGIQLLTQVRARWPNLPSIMMTASGDVRVAADAVNRNLIDFFVPKPWQNDSFLELVKRALQKHQQPAGEKLLLGKYRLLEKLAAGGMAELYLAEINGPDRFSKKFVLKKVLPHLATDPVFLRMFSEEARIMVELNHGNIVSVIDYGQHQGEAYLVMEYVAGTDLRHLLDVSGTNQPLPVSEACLIARQVALGLDYAHNKTDAQGRPLGIVHRDIAPQNILLSREGAVKITDFGIARASGRMHYTQPGMVRGTLYYMSYEQLCAQPIDARTDVYALGAVLYEMLTGRPPYYGANYHETVGLIARGRHLPAYKVNRGVPKEISDVVDKALRQNLLFRFQSAADFEQALGRAVERCSLHCTQAQLARLVNERVPKAS
jgi:serine/threonine protein kinase